MNDTATGTVDTRDMLVVHAALLREIRLAPAAVERATARRSRARTARHLRLVLHLLEHHHSGEDRLLLPLLQARVPAHAAGALDTGEEQHARIEALLGGIGADLDRWSGGADAASLVASLTELHAALEPHLRGEERDVLPLAAAHLTPAEWQALGDEGFASTPKSALVTVFGMFMYGADPQVVRDMLAQAPAPVRVLMPRIAPAAYTRLCRAVHGTPAPEVANRPDPGLDPVHRHTARCYWDVDRCGWHCPPSGPAAR